MEELLYLKYFIKITIRHTVTIFSNKSAIDVQP